MRKNLPVTQVEKDFNARANILSTTNTKGIITYVNQDFIDISGFTNEELINKNHNIVRHPDMPELAFADLWATVKSGKSWMGVVKNRCKDGSHYWVDAFVTPIMKNGAIAEFQSIRRKPDRSLVKRAEGFYKKLSGGSLPWYFNIPVPGFRLRLVLAAAVVLYALLFHLLEGIDPAAAWQGFATGLALSVLLIYLVSWPYTKLLAASRKVVNNKVMQYVYTGRRDDLGQLMLAMRMLEAESGGIVGRLADSSEQIAGDSEQLRQAVDQSHQGLESMFSETNLVATAMTEMTSSIQEVARNAQNASEAANQAHEETNIGRQIVDEATGKIDDLATLVEESAGVIHELEKESNEISNILTLIREIATQTSLLALNATIESARAGEAGKGFAVVAYEVKVLATNTHEATVEIENMISKLQGHSKSAADKMLVGQKQALDTVEQSKKVAESLAAIASSVGMINDLNSQIAAAVDEQGSAAEEINRSVISIRNASEANMAASSDTERSSASLNDLAQELKALADQFWDKRMEGDSDQKAA